VNIAHEAVDRHANGPRRDHLTLRWLGKDGAVRDFAYADLIGLHEALGVEIPEADYGQLTTLADIIRYISDCLR
jgi:acetyl-CoA synthetase